METILPLETDVERQTRLRIEARRSRAETRRQHFLDPSTLKCGVQKSSIEEQLQERSLQREADRMASERYEQEKKRMLAEMAHLEYDRECERKKTLQQNAAYCLLQSKSRPPPPVKELVRKGDLDQNLGLSSAQIFTGEDLQQPERRRLQQMQMRNWIEEQKEIVAEKRRKEWEDELKYANDVERNIALGKQLDSERAAYDHQKLMEHTNLNAQLFETKKERDRADAAERSRFIPLEETSTFGILKELPSDSYPFTYRGMSREEQERVKEQQLTQIMENEQKRQSEREEELRWIEAHDDQIRFANQCAYQDELARKRKELELAVFSQSH